MKDMDRVVVDLRDEGESLDALLGEIRPEMWLTETPAPGWTVAHQVAHLHWTDHVAALTTAGAAGDSEAGQKFDEVIATAMSSPTTFVDDAAADLAAEPISTLLAKWRLGRSQLLSLLPQVPEGTKIRWFGPPMSATSMATARIMETWAHGQDVADALGVTREPTARLRNIAHIGVRTRDFAYLLKEKQPPAEPFRVELQAPDGESWTWGPADAEQKVIGAALDFCLLVTQRAHRDDLRVMAHGSHADEWLSIAQAFAGAPGAGRRAGSRA